MMIPKLFVLFVALTVGNLLYQAATKKNWAQAVERSFFQGVALGIAAVI